MQKSSFALQYFICILLVFSFFSCIQKRNKYDALIKQMEESLVNSNRVINISTENNLKSLEEKTTEPATMERARIWFAKAKQIAKLTSETYKDIENIKGQIKDKSVSTEFVYKKLVDYKANILKTDSSIWIEFQNSLDFPNPIEITTSVLTMLQNNIKIIENKITSFCTAKIGTTSDWLYHYSDYSAIAEQNSTYLRTGDELEIKAGIGAFSKSAMAKINIDGKNIKVGDEGYALYKIKITGKPGEYKIPVKFSYFNQATGKELFRIIDIEYTVAKPCDQ